ncbi:diacylglycerol kinase [Kaarinaea lacus]
MAKSGATGIKRIINATGYSMRGLAAAFKHESAFRQELALVVILAPAAIYIGQSNVERSILVASLILVLIVELLNSAIEAIVDRVGHEHHELSGQAKDIGSAAVFVSLANAVIIWGIIILT